MVLILLTPLRKRPKTTESELIIKEILFRAKHQRHMWVWETGNCRKKKPYLATLASFLP